MREMTLETNNPEPRCRNKEAKPKEKKNNETYDNKTAVITGGGPVT
jgi:hypothetical protein